MSTVEIITSITGEKDTLQNDQAEGNATFTCFSDSDLKSSLWNIKPSYNRFKDPRRNSRIHKIMVHKYSDADITIWIDGNTRLIMPPEFIIDKYLGDYDMAMFKHGGRNCIYDEALECAKLGLDDPETIIEQAKYYEDNEYPKQKGLLSGYFIIRRNNQKTRDLNEAWWADYCRFSRRDQISLMPAIEKSGVRVYMIPEKWNFNTVNPSMGGVVEIYSHAHLEGNFNEKKHG